MEPESTDLEDDLPRNLQGWIHSSVFFLDG